MGQIEYNDSNLDDSMEKNTHPGELRMGLRMNLVLAKLGRKATTSDFEWTQTDECAPRDRGGHSRISSQSYPHR